MPSGFDESLSGPVRERHLQRMKDREEEMEGMVHTLVTERFLPFPEGDTRSFLPKMRHRFKDRGLPGSLYRAVRNVDGVEGGSLLPPWD